MINTGTGIAPARNNQLQTTLDRRFIETSGLPRRTPASARIQQNLWGRGMRILTLVSTMVLLAAAGSVQAQKGPPGPIGPPTFDQKLNVEDDKTGSFFVFDTGSGNYTFTRCIDGYTLSGVGVVRVDGCAIHIEDVQAMHRVAVSIDECGQLAKGLVETFLTFTTKGKKPVFDNRPLFREFLGDSNMGNNLMDCAQKTATIGVK